MVKKGKLSKLFLVLALFAVTGWAVTPFGASAETSGSYAHPDIPGPDEGNPSGRSLKNVVPPGSNAGGGALGAPELKTEGSTRKGYGPGSHPHAGKEGSGSKKFGYGHGKPSEGSGKGYSHGKKGYGGHHPHHAKKHHGEGSSKGYGHHKKYSHGEKHGGQGYSGHGSGHHSKGHQHNPFRHILRYREKLGLTPDQVKEIMRMRFDWEKQRIRLGADLMIAHMELDRQVHSGVLDEKKMHELAKVIGGLKMQKAQIMVEAKISLLKALTEEQRKKIAEIHGDH